LTFFHASRKYKSVTLKKSTKVFIVQLSSLLKMEVVNVKVTVDEVTKVTTLRAVTILQEPGLFSLGQWFLTFFTYPTLLSDKITRFIPNTLNGSFIKNTKLPHSYSLK